MERQPRFTIWHGLVVSVAVHAVLSLPFVLRVVAAPPETEPLVIELQGFSSESEDVAEVKETDRQLRSAQSQQARPDTQTPMKEQPPQPQTTPDDTPPMEVAAVEDAQYNQPQPMSAPPTPAVKAPPPTPDMKAAPDEDNVNGAQEYVPPSRKVAQVEITDEQYSAMLSKKVREHASYPAEARRGRLSGVTLVSFTILTNGDLQPESLKVAKSSGQPLLDAGALSTIRASAPFPPPPREMELTIGVSNSAY
jgi:protein TonB